MWDGKDLSVRKEPSLISQLKCIEAGLLSRVEREEFRRKVRDETGWIEEEDVEEVDEEVINGLDMEENGEDGVDFVMEDSVIDSEVKVVVGRLDVWRSGEGARVMTEEEKLVLKELKEVFDIGLCEPIPNMKAKDRRVVMKVVVCCIT